MKVTVLEKSQMIPPYGRMEFYMSMKNGLLAQAEGLMESINFTLEVLAKKRKEQVALSLVAEKIKDELIRVNGTKVLEYSHYPECQEPDPKTGKTNKEWAVLMLGQLLNQDDEYIEALGDAYTAEQELAEIQADILDLSERVTADKVMCRLVGAMLGVLGDGD